MSCLLLRTGDYTRVWIIKGHLRILLSTIVSTCLYLYEAEVTISSWAAAAAAAKLQQSCPTLYDPTGGSPPGSPIPGILQTRILEWVAISFSSVGFDFSFKEIQSSSGLLLFLRIYYPKIFIESLVDICLLCLENCRDLFFTFRDLYLISLASHLKTASKFGNVLRSRVAIFEVNSFL